MFPELDRTSAVRIEGYAVNATLGVISTPVSVWHMRRVDRSAFAGDDLGKWCNDSPIRSCG